MAHLRMEGMEGQCDGSTGSSQKKSWEGVKVVETRSQGSLAMITARSSYKDK